MAALLGKFQQLSAALARKIGPTATNATQQTGQPNLGEPRRSSASEAASESSSAEDYSDNRPQGKITRLDLRRLESRGGADPRPASARHEYPVSIVYGAKMSKEGWGKILASHYFNTRSPLKHFVALQPSGTGARGELLNDHLIKGMGDKLNACQRHEMKALLEKIIKCDVDALKLEPESKVILKGMQQAADAFRSYFHLA